MLKECRACHSQVLVPIINLGEQYLSDFRTDDLKPKKYPLELVLCPKCGMAQLTESAPFDEMYTPNYGFKSGVNDTIKNDLKDIVEQAISYLKDTRIAIDQGDLSWPLTRWALDIGSNDGTLISNYPPSYHTVGIDPIEKLCKEAQGCANIIINDFFSLEAIDTSFTKRPQFDIITAISMFYDVEDPDKLIKDMKVLLKPGGVLIIQQNYFLATLVNNAYDNICHEHIGYHTLRSMEYLCYRNGLEIVDVSTSMVNGGVLRTVIQHKGQGTPTVRVQQQRDIEEAYGLYTMEPYTEFARRIRQGAEKLKRLIDSINNRGEKCYIYGASTRGGTIWQYTGLDVKDLPYAVDRNPEKVGKKIASIGVPIISEEQARSDKPEYMLVSIWFFRPEIEKREAEYLKTGRLIFPLPELEIV